MTTLKRIFAGILVLLGFAVSTPCAYAQDEGKTIVFVNNNNFGPNTVSAFSVLPGGALLTVPGSPFMTGGTGAMHVLMGTHKVTTATVRRSFLYVANSGSSNVSAFKIDTETGGLTSVTGSPFGSGLSMVASLAATPNGRYLYAGNLGTLSISEFAISPNGALTPIGSIALGDVPNGMKVSPDGRFLGVAAINSDSVAMFNIASNGPLTPVTGSPFSAGGFGFAADVEINCKSSLLFAPETVLLGTTVAVFKIASNGALSPISGSPFSFMTGGDNSNVAVLTPDGRHLHVSNQSSNTITVLDVASGGGLTQETDSPSGTSPFANPGGFVPQSEATNPEGNLLYVSNGNRVVTGFHIDSDGGLSSITGSPFPAGGTGNEQSLTVFPAHEKEGEGDEVDDNGHRGHFDFQADRTCGDSGDLEFSDDRGNEMKGKADAVSAVGNTATIAGTGTLRDGTPVTFTAIATGNQLVTGANLFAISWVTSQGSIFQTSGALRNGYIAVHP
jgi:6-phosphogluconolactonase (cycloisomerase 2 family)